MINLASTQDSQQSIKEEVTRDIERIVAEMEAKEGKLEKEDLQLEFELLRNQVQEILEKIRNAKISSNGASSSVASTFLKLVKEVIHKRLQSLYGDSIADELLPLEIEIEQTEVWYPSSSLQFGFSGVSTNISSTRKSKTGKTGKTGKKPITAQISLIRDPLAKPRKTPPKMVN